MRGHIRKRGKSWAVVVCVGREENGRPKYRWHSGYRSKADAAQALTEILSRIDAQTYVAPSKQTVRSYMREWMEAARVTVRRSTLQSYRTNIEAHVIPQLGAIPLQRLSAMDLNAFYGHLLDRGRRDGHGGLSPRTVAYCHTVLHRALKDAVRWGRLSRNVADQADPPRARSGVQMRVWSAAELHRFLEHVEADRLYAAWLLAATTGMRRGEVLGLRWKDVQLDAARVAVTNTLILVDNKPVFSPPKSARGRRSVALDASTVAALRSHRTRQLEERLAFGPGYNPDGLAFCREDGTPVRPEGFSTNFEQHNAAAGLPRIRLHDLRHTHATIMLSANVHPKVVSERLGHSSVSITLDTYSHAIPAMQEEAATRAAEVVFGA